MTREERSLIHRRLRLREFAKLEYGDPRGFLTELRKLEIEVASSDTRQPIRNLRTNSLKSMRESRDAALFCVGISEMIGSKVRFARSEDLDFDFIATWCTSGPESLEHFCPVQLKEVAPSHLNADSSIQDVVQSLAKYADSSDLVVAIKLNTPAYFDPNELEIPPNLQLGGVWVFGSVTADQSEWAIWGDFARSSDSPVGLRYQYPS